MTPSENFDAYDEKMIDESEEDFSLNGDDLGKPFDVSVDKLLQLNLKLNALCKGQDNVLVSALKSNPSKGNFEKSIFPNLDPNARNKGEKLGDSSWR